MSIRIWEHVCIYLLAFGLDQSKAIEEKRAYAEFIYQRGQLLFQDEFDTFDNNIWEHLISGSRNGNNEFEFYSNSSENSFVMDGILHIRPTLTADRFGEDFLYDGVLDLESEGCNDKLHPADCIVKAGQDIINPIQSARIRTIHSFSFVYGAVEIRAKMPRGDWIWPAMWMLPTDNAFGPWPQSGEIDIVESRGNDNFSCDGKANDNTLVESTLHFGPDRNHNVWRLTHFERRLDDQSFSDDFHVYGLQRLPDSIRFFLDDKLIGEVTPPSGGFWELGNFEKDPGGPNLWANGTSITPFDYPFYFILNVAVGGNFFSDDCVNQPYPKPWSTKKEVQMKPFWESRNEWLPTWNQDSSEITNSLQVDYIRVYDLDQSIEIEIY